MQVVTKERFEVGESPFWDERINRLVFVDVPAGIVYSAGGTGGGATEVLASVGRPVGAVMPAPGKGWWIATSTGLSLVGTNGQVDDLVAIEADVADRRANDAVVGPSGHVWFGTTTYTHDRPSGGLYRVDPSTSSVELVRDGCTLANGIAFSPTGDRMYFTDSVTRRVDVYPHEACTGTLGEPSVFAETGPNGYPDGLTVDPAGHLWVALWAGGTLQRWNPEGVLDAEIVVPVLGPTNTAFGPDGRIFVTTARGPDHRPDSGAVFAFTP